MAIQKHTAEPWSYKQRENFPDQESIDFEIRAVSGALVAETFELVGKHRVEVNPKSNARRIVACVNACAHVSTEFLENTPDLATAFMSAENARLMQVNVELLADLKLSTNGLRTVSRWSISEQTVAAITTQIIANEATISKAEAA